MTTVVGTNIENEDPIAPELRARLDNMGLVPLWESPSQHGYRAPDDGHIWRWDDMRPIMMSVSEVTSPKVVERRVIQMIDPRARFGLGEATVGAVNATMQLLLPGEEARVHRHSMNALRFVLEAPGGAVTFVDGKECPMEFGDLVLTPAWTWHSHVHRGDAPVIWLDVLDVAFHRYLGSEAFEPGPMKEVPPQVPDHAFSVPNIVPAMPYENRDYSPVFRYPYADALRALEAAPALADGSKRVRYTNPVLGGYSLAMLDSTLLQLPAGQSTFEVTVMADTVFCAVEGKGHIQVGDTITQWGPKDVFTAPANRPFRITAALGQEARIFAVSNAPMFKKLGLFEVQHRH